MDTLFDLGLEQDEWNGAPIIKDRDNRTVWISSKSMQTMFGITRQAVSMAILTYCEVGNVERDSIVKKLFTIHDTGRVEYFRLEPVLFTGMRANLTPQVIKFQFWVIDVLIQYVLDGVAENPSGALIEQLKADVFKWKGIANMAEYALEKRGEA